MSKPLVAGVQVVFLELACGLPDDHAECSHGPVPRSKSLKLAKCNKRCPDNSMTGTTGTVSQPQKALPYFIPQKTNHLNFKSLFLAGLPYSPSIMKHHQSSILKNFTRINRGSLNGPRCLRVWWWVINWSYFVAPRNVQARISTATFC